MSTIRVRRLDDDEPAYGSGMNDYVYDIDAVAQIIKTRLRFFKGEWWEDLTLGIPMWQTILGTLGTNKGIIDKIITNNILLSPYVIGISSFSSEIISRAYSCQAIVETEFGDVEISTDGG